MWLGYGESPVEMISLQGVYGFYGIAYLILINIQQAL